MEPHILDHNLRMQPYAFLAFLYTTIELVRATVKDNEHGVWLGFCFDNVFYHNNFTNNTEQVCIDSYGYANFWNETYPIGGNFWSDFGNQYPLVEDLYSGEYPQSEPDSDGIWDGPYEIDGDNIDYYPIVPEFPSQIIIPLFMTVALLAVIVHRRKHTR